MSIPFLIFFAAFFFVLGACIGSFLNVVIWRLPYRGTKVTYLEKTARLTLSWPPSHCPLCNTPIHWFQNVPILAWLVLRGRCAKCRAPIAIRYPLVELGTGLLFTSLFLAYFAGHWNVKITSLPDDWPILLLHMTFVSALLAASAIDADWFIIPPEIPWLIIGVGILASAFIDRPAIFTVDPRGPLAWPTIGASLGLIVSILLVHFKILPRSFEQADTPPPASTDDTKKKKKTPSPDQDEEDAAITPPPNITRQWPSILFVLLLLAVTAALWILERTRMASLATAISGLLIFLLGILPRDASTVDVTDEVMEEISTPNVRKEMITELAFLSFPVMGALMGSMLPAALPAAPWLGRVLGAIFGCLVGGGLVWLARIGGSLFAGKEAMGLGDIPLMGAIGAVIGAPLAVLTFFVFAPVFGLLWAIVLIAQRKPNILPYGPWLSAGAILALFVGHPLLNWYLSLVQ